MHVTIIPAGIFFEFIRLELLDVFDAVFAAKDAAELSVKSRTHQRMFDPDFADEAKLEQEHS